MNEFGKNGVKTIAQIKQRKIISQIQAKSLQKSSTPSTSQFIIFTKSQNQFIKAHRNKEPY